MSLISIKNLSVTYFLGKSNEVRALQKVNLTIEQGEFIIFFGSSGCGKSTLLYTIAGLERPTDGEVIVGDVDLAEMHNRELERYRQETIGMVFQAFYLIPSLSVEKNIMLPQMAVGVPLKQRRAEAERLMKYFGVYEQKNKLPSELSGGQQQRVAICRSLINDPDIIFADEPVGNLDSKSARDVLGLIQKLNLEQKKTVILVTHDPSHLDIADRVFFMKDGALVDTKVNKVTRKLTDTDVDIAPTEKSTKSDLELISDTFSKVGEFGVGSMLLEYKAKEVVAETLTGFTTEEINSLEAYVKDMLRGKLTDDKKLQKFLHQEHVKGGLDLNVNLSRKLSRSITKVVKDMKLFEVNKKKKRAHTTPHPVIVLRRHALEMFGVHLRSTSALDTMDRVLQDRIDGLVDRVGVQDVLDRSIKNGGVGLDRRIAKKMAKHIELLMLGKYQITEIEQHDDSIS